MYHQTLGILGFGMSKEEAIEAGTQLGADIENAKALAQNYPRALAATRFWDRAKAPNDLFYQKWATLNRSSRGVTDFGAMVDTLKKYAQQIVDLAAEVQAKSVALKETGTNPDIGGPDKKKDEGTNWGMIGGVTAAVVVLVVIAAASRR